MDVRRYEPKAMVLVLLYAYSTGVRSSRKIERLCRRDVGFRVLAGNLQPDHVTLARFRRDHHEELAGLFTEVLKLCRAAGMVRVGVVALDGTKIKANAALDSNRTYPSIEEEVQRILKEAASTDHEEDVRAGGNGDDEVPPEMRSREDRLKRLQECKALLESEAKAKADEQRRKIKERAEEEARRGEKLRGRKPSEPKKKPEEEAKANVTDPESRIMKTRSGYVQGYNAQAIVTEDQVIVAAEITDEANDVKQLHPMLEACRSDLRAAGVTRPIENVLADAGYWSESNAKRRGNAKAELFVATNKDWKQRKALRELPPPRGRIPDGLSPRDRMERKLLTKRGRGLYRKRGQTIEPTFGQVKHVRGFERFMMRGKALCA
jgi:hypothetical protein